LLTFTGDTVAQHTGFGMLPRDYFDSNPPSTAPIPPPASAVQRRRLREVIGRDGFAAVWRL
jgi:hypothetical protein